MDRKIIESGARRVYRTDSVQSRINRNVQWRVKWVTIVGIIGILLSLGLSLTHARRHVSHPVTVKHVL